MSSDELREIAHTLVQKRTGFYFLISTTNNRSLFYSIVGTEFATTINIKNFAIWLKDTFNLRGGVRNNMLQGGGEKIDNGLKNAIKTWIASSVDLSKIVK